MFGCQQVLIKGDKDTKAIIEYLCHESNSLYNCSVYYARQMWFKMGKIVSGFDLTAQMKRNKHFNAGYASAMQQTCLNVGEAFKSFKKLLSKAQKGELDQKPKAPNYRQTGGLFTVTYPKRWLKLKDGFIRFPLGNQVKAWFGISEFFLPMPSNLEWSDIKEIRILPRNRYFYAEFVYQTESISIQVDKSKVLGIDHGLNNWLACVTNVGTSFIVDGLHLKSLNQWYNKSIAKIKENTPQGFWSNSTQVIHILDRAKLMKDLQEILAIARQIGWGAADILQSYYHGTAKDPNLEVEYKENEPVTVADIAVSQYILQKLQATLGNEDFAYISEETYQLASADANPSAPWVWIIDPLDGTRDFIEKTGDYAVHIALVNENRPVLAVVAVPEAEKLYYATKGGGTFVETRDRSVPLQVSSGKRVEDLTLVVSRSHRNQRLDYLLQNLPCQNQKGVGSVGCKIATIVEQQADIYISLSGKSAPKDWDIAAPELILTEAGGKFTHFDGTPLQYNTGDINQWGGLLASNGEYHEVLCKEAERILVQLDHS